MTGLLCTSRWFVVVILASASFAPAYTQEKPPATPIVPQAMTPPAATVAPLIPEKENTVVGWLDVIPFTSKILHNTRMLCVWVPGNYFSPHNANRKYPVLYMQDGQNLFDKATAYAGEWQMDETADHLIGSFRIAQMFVVGIDSSAGDQRRAEYLPYQDQENPDVKEVHGKDYARFLITEVMPYLAKRYRIASGAANTGIGGSSYGAVVSLYSALEHPTIFGHVLIESPPLWIGESQLLKDAANAKLLPQKMYIGVGTDESKNAKHADAEVQEVKKLEKILRDRGMGQARLKVVVEGHATHNEAAWARRLPEAMLFLYGRRNGN